MREIFFWECNSFAFFVLPSFHTCDWNILGSKGYGKWFNLSYNWNERQNKYLKVSVYYFIALELEYTERENDQSSS